MNENADFYNSSQRLKELEQKNEQSNTAISEDEFIKNSVLQKMNSEYALIRCPLRVLALKDHTLMDVRDFIGGLANEKIKVGEKIKYKTIVEPIYQTVGQFWYENSSSQTFWKMDFRPDMPAGEFKDDYGQRIFNIYKGLAIKPKPGCCDLFKKHIKEVICNGHETLYDYLMKLLAHWIQNISEWTCVPVFRGPPGSGKNLFVDNFGKIFGGYYASVDKQESVMGKFNSVLENKLLLHLDEATFGGDKKYNSTLKSMVTSETYNLEKKGRDIEVRRNYVKLMISSNENFAVPVDVDDRRLVFFNVSGHQCGNKKYFDDIGEEIKNGGISAFMHELMLFDLTGFNAKSLPPGPQIYGNDNKDEGLNSFCQYLKECLTFGMWNLAVSASNECEMTKIRFTQLVFYYTEWCKERKPRRIDSVTRIGLDLQKFLSGAYYAQRRMMVEGKRVLCVTFSSLDEARESFAQKFNTTAKIYFKLDDENQDSEDENAKDLV